MQTKSLPIPLSIVLIRGNKWNCESSKFLGNLIFDCFDLILIERRDIHLCIYDPISQYVARLPTTKRIPLFC